MTITMKFGTKVRLKRTSKYYHQAPGLWGVVSRSEISGWVGVRWSDGTYNGYEITDLLVNIDEYLKAIK